MFGVEHWCLSLCVSECSFFRMWQDVSPHIYTHARALKDSDFEPFKLHLYWIFSDFSKGFLILVKEFKRKCGEHVGSPLIHWAFLCVFGFCEMK